MQQKHEKTGFAQTLLFPVIIREVSPALMSGFCIFFFHAVTMFTDSPKSYIKKSKSCNSIDKNYITGTWQVTNLSLMLLEASLDIWTFWPTHEQ